MSIAVRFNYDPAGAIAFLQALKASVKDPTAKGLRPGFTAAATTYAKFIVKRYVRLSHGGGGEWAPLRPSTIRSKGGDTRILRRTDRLLGSLRPNGPGGVFVINRKGATFGTIIKYSVYHQTGTRFMAKRMIFVSPDGPTRAQMAKDVNASLLAATKDAARQGTPTPRPVRTAA